MPATFAGLNSLQTLNVSNNKIVNLNLTTSSLLQTVNCDNNPTLTTLTLPNGITELKANACNLVSLNLSNKATLAVVEFNDNPTLATVDLQGCSSLVRLEFQNSQIQTVTTNAATFTNLRSVQAVGCTWSPANSAADISKIFYNVVLNPPGSEPKKLSFPTYVKWSSFTTGGTPSTRYVQLTANGWSVAPQYS